ncbi:putative RNA-binding protein 15B [Salmo salar]|uniref:Putative RNA-binding protein 15B n=1 Tax=Salmo salar TaxID=8030 RepID=A0A1S3P854_SALSA|nr:putative RNA-binding protein 15B [Salmo salar]|eukprot:XP_014023781.1 PREDICTED: putative RNA-binding protein 15B [Salmo salar]
MKRQAGRDSSPSRALAKRIRERERERDGARREDILPPPLALLLAESRRQHARSRSREREKTRLREERGAAGDPLHHRQQHHDLGLIGRPVLRTTAALPKGKAATELLGPRGGAGGTLEYKSLLISNLGSVLSDEHVEDGLFHEFKKFGDVSVKLSHTPELGRVAYVNFRHPEDAKEARHAKTRLVLYDRPLKVEPMYVRRRSCTPPDVSYIPIHGASYPPYRQRSLSPGAGVSSIRDIRPLRHYPVEGLGLSRERERILDYYGMLDERGRPYGLPVPEHEDIKPEDDARACRNLFIGNLDHNVTEGELRRGFDKYGIIEEVVIKRPARGQGGAYAFLKFQNLDMAHRAKIAMQGRVIGGNPVKIGYGKANPTTRLWVGGLGPSNSLAALAREFDRFGSIRNIDYVKGDNFAYIQYESLDASQAACAQMRGFPLGGPERRLRVDFAKAEEPLPRSYPAGYQPPVPLPAHLDLLPEGYGGRHRDCSLERELRARDRSPPSHALFTQRERDRALLDRDRGDREFTSPTKSLERRGGEAFGGSRGGRGDRAARSRSRERWLKERDAARAGGERRRRRSLSLDRPSQEKERGRSKVRGGGPASPEDSPDRARVRAPDSTTEPRGQSPDSSRHSNEDRGGGLKTGGDREKERDRDRNHRNASDNNHTLSDMPNKDPKTLSTLSEYAATLTKAWHGHFALKNSCFPTNMHLLEGGSGFFHSVMKDHQAKGKLTQLKIAQRLRMDQTRLDEVTRRIKQGGSEGYAVLLALQGPIDREAPPPEPGLQIRLLRHLVTYLRNKEAAGVISLPVGGAKEGGKGGMLYAFPPCDFSQQFLQTPRRTLDNLDEEHLVVVIVNDSA